MITAADMRQFVESVYQEDLDIQTGIIDNLDSNATNDALSANQGRLIGLRLDGNEPILSELRLEVDALNAETALLRTEVDTLKSQMANLAALLDSAVTGEINTLSTPILIATSGIITQVL